MKKNYTNIIRRIRKDRLLENFYHNTCNNIRIILFMREWKIHKIFANTFVISNFNIYNNINDYIDFDYKKFQIYRHSNFFDTRKNITDDNSYQAELLLLWLIYFYYARY